MSEKLCTLRTKGGGGGATQQETVLWTNSSPSSNFGWQEVTLSSDIDDFDYIKFDYKANTEVSNKISIVVSVTELKTTSNTTNSYAIGLDAYRQSSGNVYIMDRSLYRVNDTTIHFNPCRTVNATQTNDAWCIPTAIIGIKNMGGAGIKSQFKEVFICSSPGSSSDALASRGYELENAQSGDTLTGEAYNLTYLTATYTSGSTGYCQVTAKSDITAMVIKGYNTATYTVQNYTTGQLVGQCNRKSGDFLLIGIL